jgi:ketosteroid isomerase-like protein
LKVFPAYFQCAEENAPENKLMPTLKGAPTPDEFIPLYERALASQRWDAVGPLVHDDACVTFSNGAVHVGKAAVQRAFERNFAAITDEEYRISNVRWVRRGSEIAVYLFDFNWTGRVGGRPASGSGRGTSVLYRDDDGWRLLVEHLGPAAA